MARIQLTKTTSSRTLRKNVKTIVRTKATWADSWRTQRYLTPITAEATVAPNIGSASFVYHYGRMQQNDKSSFRDYDPMELEGHYICIAIAGGGPLLWVGVVTQEGFALQGDDAATYSGDQKITALELGYVLDRHAIAGAKAQNITGDAGLLGWTPPANPRDRVGFGTIGNMSAADVSNSESAGIKESRIYADNGGPWTALEYIKYLLAWHHPPGVYMDVAGQTDMLNYALDRQDVEGLTLWQALEHLIPARRGLGWRIEINSVGVVMVHIFSVLGEPVSVGDVTIEANAEQVTLSDIATSKVISDATLQVSQQQMYDRVEVFGERVKVCCTLSITEGTLEKGWTTPEETAYKAGDPSMPGSAEANDIVRHSDRFANVYQRFQVPLDWDWKAGSGTGLDADGIAYTPRFAVPEVLDDGDIDIDGEPHCIRSGKTFLRNLPFQQQQTMYGSEPAFVRPLVFAKSGTSTREITIQEISISPAAPFFAVAEPSMLQIVGDPIAGQVYRVTIKTGGSVQNVQDYELINDGYALSSPSAIGVTIGSTAKETADSLAAAIMSEQQGGSVGFSVAVETNTYDCEYYVQVDQIATATSAISCSVTMSDNEMALSVKPGINHQLGLNHFDTTTEPPTNSEPVIDYETIMATIAFDSDQRLHVIATRAGADDDSLRVLTLDADDAELWYVAPGTISGVYDGAIVRQWGASGDGTIYRDDSPMLRQIAALALAWYGKPRALLDLTWREITNRVALGSYIEDVADSIGRRDIGTIVTSKSWRFGDSPTTSIKTGYGQSRSGRMDFPGMSGPRALAREIRRMRRDVRDLRGNLSGLPVRLASGGGAGGSTGGATIEYLTLNGGAN